MDKKYEFITVEEYASKRFEKTVKIDVISAKNYYEELKKELLPTEFAV